ncbi:MAG: hypothetical protein OIN87_12400 [Candidatus Methanoperedens sp.]|nr:hypothetical protein [Candidatus Methanoperedens sp.]
MKFKSNILLILVVISASMLILFLASQEASIDKDLSGVISSDINNKLTDKNTDMEQEHTNYTILVSDNVCEGCHMSGKSSIPQALKVESHLNGGAYCLSCHEINHEKHPMSNGVSCDSCHTGPSRPIYINGSVPCNNCHNYPDALSPSEGNIITIHRPRGISCNKCHTDNCGKCHIELGTSAKWEKRLDHFKIMALAQKNS